MNLRKLRKLDCWRTGSYLRIKSEDMLRAKAFWIGIGAPENPD
jgi:hypothetical protein